MSDQDRSYHLGQMEGDLKVAAVRGGAVTVTAQAFKFALNMGSTVVLARLLTPNDFGLIAMVTAITNFATLFKDMGLSMATVQRAKIDHAQISTLFWINVVISIVIMLLIAGTAPAIAWFYSEPALTAITVALAGAFIFGGLSVQHQALLKRQMRFAALAAIEITAMVVGIAVAIASAWYGTGYWALVFMQLAVGITTAVGVWAMCGWRPGWQVRRAGVRSMLAFGGHLTSFNIINYFSRNLDNVLIGWYWGAQQVGFYNKAYQLLLLPIRQINAPIASVAVPVLSRLQNDPSRYRDFYLKAVGSIAFVTMPLVAAMAVLSKEIVGLVLGNQWLDASRIFSILAFAAFIQPVANTTGWVFISLNQTNRMAIWSLISSPLIVLSFVLGLPWGASGVALAYTICVYLLRYPSFTFCYKYSPITLKDVLSAVYCPAVISVVMGAIMYGLRTHLSSENYAWVIFTAVTSGLIVLILSILLWPSARAQVREILCNLNLYLRHRNIAGALPAELKTLSELPHRTTSL